MVAMDVLREDFAFVKGQERIQYFDAPLLESPPHYRACFCSQCGSPVPDPLDVSDWLEIPAGLLDDDPQLRPDKHIFVELKASWHEIRDDLPQLDKVATNSLLVPMARTPKRLGLGLDGV